MKSKHTLDDDPKRGLLVIPPNQPIILDEPAVRGKIKTDTFLFATCPNAPKKKYILDKAESTEGQVVYRHKNGNQRLIAKNQTIDKDTVVLYQSAFNVGADGKYKLNKYVYKVTTFNPVGAARADMPESGREIELKKTGYVFKKKVKPLSKNEKQYFKEIKGDIFPQEDQSNISDIRQTVFGDCYLLSTIGAMLAAEGGIEFFMQMMRQQNDGSTIVKLFDPKTNQPIYIQVKNSYYYEGKASTVDHRAPWIHILEKAYAVAGFVLKNGKAEYINSSFDAIYGGGGRAELAFKVLTGKDSKWVDFAPKPMGPLFPWSCDISSLAKSFASHLDSIQADDPQKDLLQQATKDKYVKMISELHPDTKSIFINADDIYIWGKFLLALKVKNDKLYKEIMDFINFDDQGKSDKQITQDLLALHVDKLESVNAPDFLIKRMRTFVLSPLVVRKEKPLIGSQPLSSSKPEEDTTQVYARFPANLASAAYTEKQVNLFKAITHELRKNKFITVSTLEEFLESVPGLRSQHAYTLLDTKTELINNREHHCLRLRNPWGRVGRVVDWRKVNSPAYNPQEAEQPDFWLDLTEFTRYFRSYTVGDSITGLSLRHTFAQSTHARTSTHSQVQAALSSSQTLPLPPLPLPQPKPMPATLAKQQVKSSRLTTAARVTIGIAAAILTVAAIATILYFAGVIILPAALGGLIVAGLVKAGASIAVGSAVNFAIGSGAVALAAGVIGGLIGGAAKKIKNWILAKNTQTITNAPINAEIKPTPPQTQPDKPVVKSLHSSSRYSFSNSESVLSREKSDLKEEEDSSTIRRSLR